MIRALAAALAICIAGSAGAVECRDVTHGDNQFTICEVDATQEDLRLFLYDDAGDVLGQLQLADGPLVPLGRRGLAGLQRRSPRSQRAVMVPARAVCNSIA